MQSRLIEIGDWLKVNGEAIYGSRTWKTNAQWSQGERYGSRTWKTNAQWSQGERPVQQYKEYKSDYKLMESVGKPLKGKAVIQAFFTRKGQTLYAITPGWPGRQLILQNVNPVENGTVKMLGLESALSWRMQGSAMIIDLSQITPDMLPCRTAYAFRIPVRPEVKPKPKPEEPEKKKEEKPEDQLEKILLDRLGDLLKNRNK